MFDALKPKFLKWLSDYWGFKVVLVDKKIGDSFNTLDGDPTLCRYVDMVGYRSHETPIYRMFPPRPSRGPHMIKEGSNLNSRKLIKHKLKRI